MVVPTLTELAVVPQQTGPWGEFWLSLLATIIGTLLGAGLGFWGALGLNDKQRRQTVETEEKRRRERRLTVLRLTSQELNLHRVPLQRLNSDLDTMRPPKDKFTIHIWEAIASEILEALGTNTEAAQQVSVAYFYLDQLDHLLTSYSVLAARGGSEFAAAWNAYLPMLRDLQAKAVTSLAKASTLVEKLIIELSE